MESELRFDSAEITGNVNARGYEISCLRTDSVYTGKTHAPTRSYSRFAERGEPLEDDAIPWPSTPMKMTPVSD
ncbi:hypothetical protein HZH68_001165 [Vespula germanica]|uniref:Uncharacterized protein n=1 Tax=Vespula germanica TaxID=30212 RepID=A0A834NV39_VESGE|nr:hypothetical protein HZH68_001165 [Vespula germanica]